MEIWGICFSGQVGQICRFPEKYVVKPAKVVVYREMFTVYRGFREENQVPATAKYSDRKDKDLTS
jgi:hypothetical protein